MRTCLLLVLIAMAAGAEAVPDPGQVRARIAALVDAVRASGAPPTLGLVHEAVGLAISYGAPAYNAGDREGCGRFYAETAGTLVTAFADGRPTGPLARQALEDLAAAAARFAAADDAERKAWTMRLAFDLVEIAWDGESARGAAFVRLAAQYLKRGQYAEAEAAAERGEEIRLETLSSRPGEGILDLRLAPLISAQALLAQDHCDEAGGRLVAGLPGLGDLAGSRLDLRALLPAGDDLATALLGLERHLQEHADDRDALALLAFELRFSGAAERAGDAEARLKAAAPDHALVRWWEAAAAAPTPAAPAAPAGALH